MNKDREMFIPCLRKRLGWTLFLGGAALLAYEIYIWRTIGLWSQFPLALAVEWVVHRIADVMEYVPVAKPQSVQSLALFSVSDLPSYLSRFFKIIPLSGFSLVLGYFFIRWEKYLGI